MRESETTLRRLRCCDALRCCDPMRGMAPLRWRPPDGRRANGAWLCLCGSLARGDRAARADAGLAVAPAIRELAGWAADRLERARLAEGRLQLGPQAGDPCPDPLPAARALIQVPPRGWRPRAHSDSDPARIVRAGAVLSWVERLDRAG